jgi:hypothetical protein
MSFPLWILLHLMDVLAAQTQTAHVVMTIGTERRQPFVLRGEGVGLTIKYLCASCNSGWMSSLETHAKPYVLAMLRDVTIPLDREAQSTIGIPPSHPMASASSSAPRRSR